MPDIVGLCADGTLLDLRGIAAPGGEPVVP